jgi:hypothetical protein
MHDYVRSLLNAYLDGELNGIRRQEVERHLSECQACQTELRELKDISNLLRAAPEPDFLPAARFAANLNLQLALRESQAKDKPKFSWIWWMVPAGLLIAWIFVQTVFTLTDAATVAHFAGLLGKTTWFIPNQSMFWFNTAAGLFGGRAVSGQPALETLNMFGVFGENLLEGFLWQTLIALLYLGWLAAMWSRQRPGIMGTEEVKS